MSHNLINKDLFKYRPLGNLESSIQVAAMLGKLTSGCSGGRFTLTFVFVAFIIWKHNIYPLNLCLKVLHCKDHLCDRTRYLGYILVTTSSTQKSPHSANFKSIIVSLFSSSTKFKHKSPQAILRTNLKTSQSFSRKPKNPVETQDYYTPARLSSWHFKACKRLGRNLCAPACPDTLVLLLLVTCGDATRSESNADADDLKIPLIGIPSPITLTTSEHNPRSKTLSTQYRAVWAGRKNMLSKHVFTLSIRFIECSLVGFSPA